jgi:hypothetical protein
MNALLFWMILMLVFLVAYALGVQRAKARSRATREPALEGAPSVGPETLAALQSRLAPMLAITGYKALGNVVQFTGHLRGKSDEVFRRIREAFAGEPVTPLLLEGEENDVRVVMGCSCRQRSDACRSSAHSAGLFHIANPAAHHCTRAPFAFSGHGSSLCVFVRRERKSQSLP